MFNKLTSFLQESKLELSRVNWPSREETMQLTAMVIGISILFALFLGFLDFLFTYLLELILFR